MSTESPIKPAESPPDKLPNGKFAPGNRWVWKPGIAQNPMGAGRKPKPVPLARIREQLQEVWDEANGPKMMLEQAKKNPQYFLSAILSLLPKVKEIDVNLQVNADIRATVTATMAATTKMLREMRARGEMTGFSPFARLPVSEGASPDVVGVEAIVDAIAEGGPDVAGASSVVDVVAEALAAEIEDDDEHGDTEG